MSKVLITIESNTRNNGKIEEPIMITTVGTCEIEQNSFTIEYESSIDESEPAQKVCLTMANNSVNMQRDGKYGSNMYFKKGETFKTFYNTPGGDLEMNILPNYVMYECNQDVGGKVILSYNLIINGNLMGIHDYKLSFSWNK